MAENADDYTVDITRQDRKVTAYRIASATPREVEVRINGANPFSPAPRTAL